MYIMEGPLIMKKLLSIIILTLLPLNSLLAIGGFGLHIPLNRVSVASNIDESNVLVYFEQGGFENPLGFGGYFYIDAIPFVDLDVEFQLIGQKYDIKFYNVLSPSNALESDFGWASASTYFTVKKKILGIGIPFLAKAKLHVGGGYNMHTYTPTADLDMMKELVGGTLGGDLDTSSLTNKLESYLTDNKKDASGFHVQAGVQFKLLMLDTHFFYRYTMAKDVYEGSKAFGSFNIRVGIGI